MATVSFAAFAAQTSARIDDVVRKVGFDLATAIVERSPVDTGRFRGNWFASVDTPATGTREVGMHSSNAEAAKALVIPPGRTFYFVNNLPYAWELEYGSSKQAPQGMVRLTVLEFGSVVQKAVKALK